MTSLEFAMAAKAPRSEKLNNNGQPAGEVCLLSYIDSDVGPIYAFVVMILLLGGYGSFVMQTSTLFVRLSMFAVVLLFICHRMKKRRLIIGQDWIRVAWTFTSGKYGYESIRTVTWTGRLANGVSIVFVDGRYFDVVMSETSALGVSMLFALAEQRGVDTSKWLPLRAVAGRL